MPNVLSPRDLVFRPDIGHKLYHHQLLKSCGIYIHYTNAGGLAIAKLGMKIWFMFRSVYTVRII